MWKYQKGLTVQADDFMDVAHKLSEEMIENYKTVQSFGQEEEVIKKYK